ncbi:glycosyltrsansferase, family 19 [Emiliania huxleyi CCMP1516]|uniref:lipid-A-disaccharide synthase n=2 Tax=Emiliania huxleyi TaxID=2903 RepID=A0A0D3IT69_EMIH1|nr:glycosyltrsansferase, family 19 [Emiliania huxleyi CCMP1516]EOD14454.1 glycosyltrsansferase, family 19 [Emiliania huxleyi CCMP1516]|eukprot:XP_005766883.1 glycosyltrsansferase, family 19 [Emiliania huxleyi CCMP1516]
MRRCAAANLRLRSLQCRRLSSRSSTSPAVVFLVAGEASGDVIGGRLMRALRNEYGGAIHFEGVGGDSMRAEGLASSLFPMSELSVAGFAEVLPSLPRIAARLVQTQRAVRRAQPHVVVGIDSKGFNLRLLRSLAHRRAAAGRNGIPAAPVLVQYVGPSAWAFGDADARAARLRGGVDELLALFRRAGVPATFVGHPALDDVAIGGEPPGTAAERAAEAAAFRREVGLSPCAQVLCLLPGSRAQEVRAMLPLLLRGAASLAERRRRGEALSSRWAGPIELVVPAAPGMRGEVDRIVLETLAARGTAGGGARCSVVGSGSRRAAFGAADVAIAACGTINLELAAAGVPQVAVYSTSWLTGFVIRRLLRPVLRHASLPNILAGRTLLTELLFEDCTPCRIAEEADFLLARPSLARAEAAQIRQLVLPSLRAVGDGGEPQLASRAAARALLRHLPEAQTCTL